MKESPAPPDSKDVLAGTPAFADLAPDVFERILSDLRQRDYEAGEALIRQGDPGDGLLVMVHGTALVELRPGASTGGATVTRAGSQTIAGFGPGDVVGEMALVTRAPRSADVIASTPVRVLWLSAEAFDRLVMNVPEVGVVLTNLVAKRLGEQSLDGFGGKVVGAYRIVRALGRGEMAVVYEAERLADGRRVALKMMSHRLLYERGAAARFQREAATLMRLDHENVARVHDCFPAFRTSFIAMELVDGPDLDRLIARHGPLSEEDVRPIVGQIAAALSYLHDHGIVHRDLKPSNVMVNREGVVKVTDFGLARQLGGAADATITQDLSIVGTPRYMTVSQLAGERPGPEADVYALGLIALELCQGRPTFDSPTFGDLLRAKQSFAPPPAASIGRGVSDALRAFVADATDPARGRDRAVLDAAALWAAPTPPALLSA